MDVERGCSQGGRKGRNMSRRTYDSGEVWQHDFEYLQGVPFLAKCQMPTTLKMQSAEKNSNSILGSFCTKVEVHGSRQELVDSRIDARRFPQNEERNLTANLQV